MVLCCGDLWLLCELLCILFDMLDIKNDLLFFGICFVYLGLIVGMFDQVVEGMLFYVVNGILQVYICFLVISFYDLQSVWLFFDLFVKEVMLKFDLQIFFVFVCVEVSVVWFGGGVLIQCSVG